MEELDKADSVVLPKEHLLEVTRAVFLYALVWGAGGILDTHDRRRLDMWLMSKIGSNAGSQGFIPPPVSIEDSVFSWQFEPEALEWQRFIVPDFVLPSDVCTAPHCLRLLQPARLATPVVVVAVVVVVVVVTLRCCSDFLKGHDAELQWCCWRV